MKPFYFTIIFMLALIFVNGQNCKNIELVYKKGIAYSDTTNKYSGRYIEYYPGKQKMRGNYKNGLKDGLFIYFYWDGSIQKEENWQKGIKNGNFINYDSDGKMISNEYYKNGLLDSNSYYFHHSQLLKKVINYNQGKAIDSVVYQIPNNIWDILPTFPLEDNYSIDKLLYKSLDSIILSLYYVEYQDMDFSNPKLIPINNLKIISFKLYATVRKDNGSLNHDDAIIHLDSNYISKRHIDYLFGNYTKSIVIDRILVMNEDGYKWEIQPREIEIKNSELDW